jgi:hypothetical protein
MNRYRYGRTSARSAALLSVLLLAVSLSGETAASPVTGSASLGALNRYIFRGYRLGRDSFVLQPALTVSYAGFSATFWANLDMKEKATECFVPDRAGRKSLDETDLTLSYARSFGKLGLTAGFIYYATKFTAETQEMYVGASLDIPGKPTLAICRDIAAYPGTYILFSIAHSVALTRRMGLDLGASAAYFAGSSDYWRTYVASAGSYTGGRYHAFHDGMLKAALTFPLTTGLVLQAGTQLYFPLSAAAGRMVDGHPYNINGQLKTVLVLGTVTTFSF